LVFTQFIELSSLLILTLSLQPFRQTPYFPFKDFLYPKHLFPPPQFFSPPQDSLLASPPIHFIASVNYAQKDNL